MVATTALVPQAANAVSVPVVASGGIPNDQQVLATALVLGTGGARAGTAFLIAGRPAA